MTRGADEVLRSEKELHIKVARMEKAIKIADVLDALDCSSKETKKLEEYQWGYAESIAGVNKTSLDTRQLVISLLEKREEVRRKAENGLFINKRKGSK